MKTVSFKTTTAEAKIISQITDRAVTLFRRHGVKADRMTIMMDLTACHANGNPLELERLLAFPDFDFAHDVSGINRHINRETGQLEGFFSPRCSRAVQPA